MPWVLVAWGELTIDSAMATVLNATVPLFTMLIAHLFLYDDRMTGRRMVGLVMGFAGVLLLVQRDTDLLALLRREGAGDHLLAQLAVMASSASYGIGGVFARSRFRGRQPLLQAFAPLTMAMATLWIATPLTQGTVRLPQSALGWPAVLYLGLLSSGMAYLLYFHLLAAVGPTRASLVTYAIPLVGIALGVVFLGERLDAWLVGGALLILSSVWVVSHAPATPTAVPEPQDR